MSSAKFSRLDPAQRREQILDAANALFAERPYDEVSIADIANAAGVARGLVHHYFRGRREVTACWPDAHDGGRSCVLVGP